MQKLMKLYLETPLIKYDIERFPEKSDFRSLEEYMQNAEKIIYNYYIRIALVNYKMNPSAIEEGYKAYVQKAQKIPLPYKSLDDFIVSIKEWQTINIIEDEL
jgi:hypothetical protein